MLVRIQALVGSPQATEQRFSRFCRWIITGDQAAFLLLPEQASLHVSEHSLDLHRRRSKRFLASVGGSARATKQRLSRFGNKQPCTCPSTRWICTGDQAALFSPPAGASLRACHGVAARVRVRCGRSARALGFLISFRFVWSQYAVAAWQRSWNICSVLGMQQPHGIWETLRRNTALQARPAARRCRGSCRGPSSSGSGSRRRAKACWGCRALVLHIKNRSLL